MHIFYMALSNRFMAQARREKGGSVVYSSERKKRDYEDVCYISGFLNRVKFSIQAEPPLMIAHVKR